MANKKLLNIYGFFNGKTSIRGTTYYTGIAIAEDGIMLAAVFSESMEAIKCDLGLDGISTLNHRLYDAYAPKVGWQGEFIEPLVFKEHDFLQNAIRACESKKRNKKPYRYIQGMKYDGWKAR